MKCLVVGATFEGIVTAKILEDLNCEVDVIDCSPHFNTYTKRSVENFVAESDFYYKNKMCKWSNFINQCCVEYDILSSHNIDDEKSSSRCSRVHFRHEIGSSAPFIRRKGSEIKSSVMEYKKRNKLHSIHNAVDYEKNIKDNLVRLDFIDLYRKMILDSEVMNMKLIHLDSETIRLDGNKGGSYNVYDDYDRVFVCSGYSSALEIVKNNPTLSSAQRLTPYCVDKISFDLNFRFEDTFSESFINNVYLSDTAFFENGPLLKYYSNGGDFNILFIRNQHTKQALLDIFPFSDIDFRFDKVYTTLMNSAQRSSSLLGLEAEANVSLRTTYGYSFLNEDTKHAIFDSKDGDKQFRHQKIKIGKNKYVIMNPCAYGLDLSIDEIISKAKQVAKREIKCI